MSGGAPDQRSFSGNWRRRSQERVVTENTGNEQRRVHSMTYPSGSRSRRRSCERTASVFSAERSLNEDDTPARSYLSSPRHRRQRRPEDIQSWRSACAGAPERSDIEALVEVRSQSAASWCRLRQDATSCLNPCEAPIDTLVNPNEDEPGSSDGSVEEIDRLSGVDADGSSEYDTPQRRLAIDQGEGLRRSIGQVFGWLAAAANRQHHPGIRQIPDESERSAVDALEDLLLWHDVWRSGRALFGGMYSILCIKIYLDTGIHIIQPSTVVSAITLCVLAYNALIKRISSTGQTSSNDHTEAVFLDKLTRGIIQMGHQAASTLPPFIAVTARSVSGAQGPQSFYLAVVLWSFMLIGELRILSQLGMLLLMYSSLFVLPLMYTESKWLLDGLAIAGWNTVLTGLRVENRKELGFALGLGFAVSYLLDVGLVVRITAGMAGAVSVLLWRLNI